MLFLPTTLQKNGAGNQKKVFDAKVFRSAMQKNGAGNKKNDRPDQ